MKVRSETGNGKWQMGNGEWEMGNGKWEMEYKLADKSALEDDVRI